MKILQIEDKKRIKKSKKELQQELNKCDSDFQKLLISEYKTVPSKEPKYIVLMSMKEFQLISFYLELEHRKPIMNVKVDATLKENKDEKESSKTL